MEMTRRQFALSMAAATTLRPSLFEPPFPQWEFRAALFLAESLGCTIRQL